MNRPRPALASFLTPHAARQQRGIALFYLSTLLFVLLAFCGLAIDLGRGYIVKAHLSKAVDGAALAAARYIGDGQSMAQAEASKIFRANFPNGFLGASSVQNPPNINFSIGSDGSNVIAVDSTAVIPTTFMNIAGFKTMTVSSSGQATRRLVDLSFVMDKSGSLNPVWSQVKSAAQQFVSYFDPNSDRLSLVMFSGNTVIMDPIRTSGRGFDKAAVLSHIGNAATTGFTGSSEGLYQGWDQIRRVPAASQSALRIIVLFTDGAPNTFSGRFDVASGAGTTNLAGALHTNDFPNVAGQGQNNPETRGLYQIYGSLANPSLQWVPPTDSSYTSGTNNNLLVQNLKIRFLPNKPADLMPDGTPKSFHPSHSSAGIPDAFPLYDGSLPGQRPLVANQQNNVKNANNASRNLVEIIANAVRADNSGAYPIRIYALGLGDLLNQGTGEPHGPGSRETGSSILMRVANDPASPDFNSGQTPGKYFYAGDPVQLNAAFQSVRNLIVRLSQ
jgi:Flp pilus assembly protein TadG